MYCFFKQSKQRGFSRTQFLLFYCSINFIYVQYVAFINLVYGRELGETQLYLRMRHWAEREAPEPPELVGRIHTRGSHRQRWQRSSQPGPYPELHCNRTFRAVPSRSFLLIYVQAAIISGEKKVPFLAVYCGFSSLCLLKPATVERTSSFPRFLSVWCYFWSFSCASVSKAINTLLLRNCNDGNTSPKPN